MTVKAEQRQKVGGAYWLIKTFLESLYLNVFIQYWKDLLILIYLNWQFTDLIDAATFFTSSLVSVILFILYLRKLAIINKYDYDKKYTTKYSIILVYSDASKNNINYSQLTT